MNRYLFLAPIFLLVTSAPAVSQSPGPSPIPSPQIEVTYRSGTTIVRMDPIKISDKRGNYYSLYLVPSFRYEGKTPTIPEYVELEIQSEVKGTLLNPDLYVVFVVDGKEVFLSSNRWAVRNETIERGRIGERIVMRMPIGAFKKLATAEQASLRMGATVFEIGSEQKAALLELTRKMM